MPTVLQSAQCVQRAGRMAYSPTLPQAQSFCFLRFGAGASSLIRFMVKKTWGFLESMAAPSVSGQIAQTSKINVWSTGACSSNEACKQYSGAVDRKAPASRCNATATLPAVAPCPEQNSTCASLSTPGSSQGSCQNAWAFAGLSCSGGQSQSLCSELDPSTCPNLAGIAPTSVQWGTPPNVVCTYDLWAFTNYPSGTNAWLAAFTGTDAITQQGYQTLMNDYCSVSSLQDNFPCLGNLGECSRVFADIPNNPCLTWYNNLKNEAVSSGDPTTLDSFIAQYCGANVNSSDCACANAYLSPTYQGLINATDSVASCWYSPCSGGAAGTQFQPSSVLANQFGHSPCPQDVCAEVESFINSQGNQDNTFNQNLICGVPSGGGTGGGGISPAPSEPLDRNPLFWVGIGSVVLLLIVLLVAVLARRKGK